MSQLPQPLIAQNLASLRESNIHHGFFTRRGGISTGIYASLNCGRGSQDIKANVDENRRRVAQAINVADDCLFNVYQVHSPDVMVIDRMSRFKPRAKADAMVTKDRGIALAILTADCGPVLFCDSVAQVIGAAHAGWRGALSGVLENTVAAMESLGAKRSAIKAALGPSISQKNYEVGREFVSRFTTLSDENIRFFKPGKKAEHYLFDLRRYIQTRLEALRVECECLDRCTYQEHDQFFSYRRSTHHNENDYGRQISVITITQ